MTKVQLEYKLARRLDDEVLLDAVARAHGVYGMVRVMPTPQLDGLTVEYDASRLNPSEVEDCLRRSGLPVVAANPPAE
jgi:hypothetical protein